MTKQAQKKIQKPSRFKRTVAGLALAGALVGGAAVADAVSPAGDEAAYSFYSGWGVSWQ